MKKGAIIGIVIIAAAALLTLLGVILFSKKDLDRAIDEFEDHDYVDSIIILNRLARTAGYESGEKIYYYRCRAVNRLASQMEEKYADELAEIAREKKSGPGYEKEKKDIDERLAKVNRKIDGDLYLMPAMKKSRIVPRGKFYDEFIAKYRGSGLIQDLQFEEVQNIGRAEPDMLIPAMINFYNKYPNTDYISGMVKILFDNLQKSGTAFRGREDVLWKMILAYVKRYPTSPETNKLYICTGNNVNLRNSPGVDGKLVGKIPREEILIQLEKSMDTTQIGDARDYWYRVASLGGLRGWIFGKFLAPVDLSKYKDEETGDAWTLDEEFAEWTDSHTPSNWSHVPGGDPTGINFSVRGKRKVAELRSAKGSHSGLFSRFSATRAFSILCRARFAGGDAVTIFAYTMPDDRTFYVTLREEQAEVDGRTIPLRTLDWHDYNLQSADGRYAKLLIDGEEVSSRIEPMRNKSFPNRGIYCLFSSLMENSRGEMEYIKVR